MADSVHTPTLPETHSRRQMLALAGGLAAATAAAGTIAVTSAKAGVHPDAELIRLKGELDERLLVLRDLDAEHDALSDTFDVALGQMSAPPAMATPEWWALVRSTGLKEAGERLNKVYFDVDRITRAIRETPAVTFQGLVAKAWGAAFNCHFWRDFDEPEDDMDWDVKSFLSLLRDIEAMAAREVVS